MMTTFNEFQAGWRSPGSTRLSSPRAESVTLRRSSRIADLQARIEKAQVLHKPEWTGSKTHNGRQQSGNKSRERKNVHVHQNYQTQRKTLARNKHHSRKPSLSVSSTSTSTGVDDSKFSQIFHHDLSSSLSLPDSNLQAKPRLIVPSANDKVWDDINDYIYMEVRKDFSQSRINKKSSSIDEVCNEFDEWIYKLLLRFQFKPREPKEKKKTYKKRENHFYGSFSLYCPNC